MNQSQTGKDAIDFKQYLKILKRFWYVPIIFTAIALSIAWFKIKYATPIYIVKASLQVKDKSTYAYGSQNFIQGMNMFNSFKNISNEVALMSSYGIIETAVKEFNNPITYIEKGDIRDYEFYKNAPVELEYDSSFVPVNTPIHITILDNTYFLLSIKYGSIKPYDPFTMSFIDTICGPVSIKEKKLAFGEKIMLNNLMIFSINKTHPANYYTAGKEYTILFNDLENLTYSAKGRLKVGQTSEESSIITLTSAGPIKQREVDFLNKVVEVYLRKGLEEKNQIATNTIVFIDNQLIRIADSLQYAENKLEKFKQNNKVFSLDQAAENAYAKMMDLEHQRADLILQNKYYEYLRNYVNEDRPFNDVVAPTTVNIADPLLNTLIGELVALYQERNALKFTSYDKSPAYQTIQLRIKASKEALLENVDNIVKASQVALNDINGRIKENEQALGALPSQERNFINIQRRFVLNDNIYNYLLQKRAEASIAKASNLPDASIIDQSRIRDAVQIFPNPNNYYSIALFTALALSIVFILMINIYFDRKVDSKEDVEKYSAIPIIGGIGLLKNNKEEIKDRHANYDALTESFRSIRVNMQYMAAGKKSVIIGVTSCISGDGKSFTSLNLARIYGMGGKKVLLICADLRKKMHNIDYGIPENVKGLSDYLIDSVDLKQICYPTNIENVTVIPSGGLPPNAAELLASDKMHDMLREVRTLYDIIVLDSSPAGIVSDYLTLMPFIDINVYVVRMDYTPKDALPTLQRIIDVNNEGAHCIILNGIKRGENGYGYGYNYGYGYGMASDKKTWFSRSK